LTDEPTAEEPKVTDTSHIIIDLVRAESRDPDELRLLRRAGEDLGIIQVVNHGVDEGVIDGFHDRAGAILALPRAEKIPLASPTGHPYRGWRQWPDDMGRLELERFAIAQYDSPEEAQAAGLDPRYAGDYAHPNVWPPQEPQLRAVARAYHAAAVAVARRVVSAYALALGQAPDVFPLGSGPDHTRFVVNNYPTWTHDGDLADEDKLLLLEHADGSVVTVLHQRGDYDGLQGKRKDGSWVTVPVVPGRCRCSPVTCSPAGPMAGSGLVAIGWWRAAPSPGCRAGCSGIHVSTRWSSPSPPSWVRTAPTTTRYSCGTPSRTR
jgi:isopenicillin N synthase-like dioxygenase